MTHYTVLVRFEGDIGDAEEKISEMMAPYDENLDVERYKKRISSKNIQEAFKHYKLPNSNTTLLTSDQIKEYFGEGGGKDAKGYFYWSTYNPKSKWDWYEIGGRWQGLLLTKGTGKFNRRTVHDPKSVAEAIAREKGEGSGRVDIAYLKDADFDKMNTSEIARMTEDYYTAVDYVLKEMEEGKTFDDCVATLYFEYGISDKSLEEMLAEVSRFSTHSVLDKDGWHEPSRMGWWGVEMDEKEDKKSWASMFAERFLSNPTDQTVIAVVDAHI